MILGEELEKVFQSVHEPGWPYWANFRLLGDCFLGQFYEKYSSRQKCRLLFSKIKVIYILFMARNGIGYVLSVFFTNSSGRPATNLGMLQRLAAIEGILQTNLIFTGKNTSGPPLTCDLTVVATHIRGQCYDFVNVFFCQKASLTHNMFVGW
jgi:hypothetical protein